MTELKLLENRKEKLQSEVDGWKEYEDKVKVLLPFEEIQKLEKEIELLKLKERIVNKEIEKERAIRGQSKELDSIFIRLQKEIEVKKEKIRDTREIGKSIRITYHNKSIEEDPRKDIKKELARQSKYQKIVELLGQHIELIQKLNVNVSNIINNVTDYNKGYVIDRLVSPSRDKKERLRELKKSYEQKIARGRGLKNELQRVEKELEETRAELIARKELAV
ncbi:hypothetical protein [Halothermothrix orenii]|uniref:Uncharacterized protein n=1 Tax=Halothermothrix orenii (strain H 168 / OCM 544 / DSM 9562) TaxID=373903 RepID=B8D1N5_HALOH|nr:hypothetical protein [Halothermothrix orenii]ACL69112.1 hypothetical protein Hore_03510 [Halothermothrix orenii H 168]